MRTSARSALLTLLMVLCFAAPLFAQTKEPVVKSPRGSISGRVTIKDKPARGVTVGLRHSNLMSSSDSFTKVVTDADGFYRMADVPAGSYLLLVAAPAFINPDVNEYKTVVLSEGENIEKINFSLVRGGVITGKVTDAEGRPVILQSVFIVPTDGVDAPRAPQSSMNALTDDRGMYRVFGIRPGRYKVAAGQSDQMTGVYFGMSKYKRVFHPDATDPAKATVIEVSEGSEASKVDITLGGVAPSFSVSGRIINETGSPVPNLNFVLRPSVGQRIAFSRSDARGEFVMEGVVPGKYSVMVVDDSSTGLRGDKVTVEVVDRDLTDVTIKLSIGLTVSGVVILESDDKAVRNKLSEMLVEGGVRPSGGARYGSSSSGPIAADGSFTIKGLANGTLELSLASFRNAYPLKGFSISRIEKDGVITPRIDLQEGQNVTGVKIFVSYGTASVRGVVTVENGSLPSAARIYLRLSGAGDNSPFYKNAAADERGRFVIDGIAAGTYEINAFVGGIEKRPKPVKQQISLSDGVTTEVNLAIDLAALESPGNP